MKFFIDEKGRLDSKEFDYCDCSPICFLVERKQRAFWLFEGREDDNNREWALVKRNGRTIKEAQK